MVRETLSNGGDSAGERKGGRGLRCPCCRRLTGQPADGDQRTRVCSTCGSLILVGAGNDAYPAGIRKGIRCTSCGRCTVADRRVECWGATVIVLACRNPRCGMTAVYPLDPITIGSEGVSGETGEADTETPPLKVAHGISDLLDEVRR